MLPDGKQRRSRCVMPYGYNLPPTDNKIATSLRTLSCSKKERKNLKECRWNNLFVKFLRNLSKVSSEASSVINRPYHLDFNLLGNNLNREL